MSTITPLRTAATVTLVPPSGSAVARECLPATPGETLGTYRLNGIALAASLIPGDLIGAEHDENGDLVLTSIQSLSLSLLATVILPAAASPADLEAIAAKMTAKGATHTATAAGRILMGIWPEDHDPTTVYIALLLACPLGSDVTVDTPADRSDALPGELPGITHLTRRRRPRRRRR